jgi:signal transduction histidine kinase/ActR/RegA family two-component response regulator
MGIVALLQRLTPKGLGRQLQVVAVIAVLGILALAALQMVRMRSLVLAQTEQQMARLDMVFAEQTGRALETVDLALQGVADEFRRNEPGSTGTTAADQSAFSAIMARRISSVRQSSGIAVADRNGRMLLVSDPGLSRIVLPREAQAAIVQAIDHPTSWPQISGPFRRPDGSWTALMIRPVPESAGPGHYAAIAFLNLHYFEDFYKAVELTEHGAIMLHRRDGLVLARYPHEDAAMGQSFANTPPFKDVLANGMAGTLIMDSPLDGEPRVLAIRALKMFPIAVNVSVGAHQVLALWRRQALVFGVAAGVIAAVTVGLLMLLSARSRERERLVERLRRAKRDAEAATARMAAEAEERERMEGALRLAQRSEAIGQLTRGVAHDFNNLLSIVMGNVDLLERMPASNDKTLGRLATIRAAAERGATLTSQLLAFARRQPLLPRAADLNALISGLRDLVQSAVGSRIKLQLRMRPDLGAALIDPAQIELVVLNLAINARDALPEGGVLTIETDLVEQPPSATIEGLTPGPWVVLTVRDTGVGMEPEVAARAFEPFFTTKVVGQGSGLGLSQVHGVAHQLGGGAHIETAPGEGTAVHVYLPRATTEPVHSPDFPSRTPTDAVSPACVLVVDDDHAVRATTAALLAELGYHVLEAGGGAEALEVLEQEQPIHLMLTDVVMPAMTGPELARRARQQFPHLAVVFISGYSDPDALSGTDGLVFLVRKPARPLNLVEKIEAALQSSVVSFQLSESERLGL